ncbi:unnamed protein product [Polarella glacialis]|uniref:PAS domain-containing protein n=1 Tax=Polarella glacialis TaxID=89957 RepID=A0A813H267_POLGL|nr:unnamed protein product [Polarella glacialis]
MQHRGDMADFDAQAPATDSSDDELLAVEAVPMKDRFEAQISEESDVSTACSREEEFVQQCAEIDALATKAVGESSIREALGTALAGAQVSVSIADPRSPDVGLIAVSDAFLAMTGYDRQEVIGKNCRFLSTGCTPSSEDIFRLRMACETGAPFTGVLMNCRKNGEFFFNLLDLRGLTVARNNVTGKELWFLVGIQADVTDCIELSEDFERARFSDVGPLDHMQQVASSIRANLADKLSALAVSAAMRSSAFEGVKLEDASKDSDPEAWCLLPSPIWKKEPSLPGRRSGTTARSPLESGLPSISVKQPLEFLAVASVSTAAWLCLGSFFYFVSCQK